MFVLRSLKQTCASWGRNILLKINVLLTFPSWFDSKCDVFLEELKFLIKEVKSIVESATVIYWEDFEVLELLQEKLEAYLKSQQWLLQMHFSLSIETVMFNELLHLVSVVWYQCVNTCKPLMVYWIDIRLTSDQENSLTTVVQPVLGLFFSKCDTLFIYTFTFFIHPIHYKLLVLSCYCCHYWSRFNDKPMAEIFTKKILLN